MNLGRAIQILRETNNIRRGDLARDAGLSMSMLSMIENGQREPSLSALRRLAGALGVPVDVLLAASQPGEGTLASSDERADSLADILQRLERLEEEIREMTGKRAAG